MLEGLHWLGHSSFRWDGTKTIYFDPWKLSKNPNKADIICISHEHFDHCSKKDIMRIATPDTVIITCAEARRQLEAARIDCKEIKAMAPGDSADIDGITVTAVASYNTNKEFHQKSAKKLGFIVTMDGVSVYHAGDTDRIPEMDGLKCDAALLPISGTYVMTAEEAAAAALVIKPKIAIPIHYGDIIGTNADAKRFESALHGTIEVKILRKED